MIPSLSLTSSPSSSSATVRVDKATSDLLLSPDWSINMEICDLCNSNHWMAKDMLKGVKRRLQHKNPKVQLLTLTGDMHVRDKILILLDSWQEAFGSPGGKYSQYYWACDELRRCGIRFPERPERAAPVITPPVTHQPRVPQVGFGMPSDSSQRLDEAMRSEGEGLSFSTLESMRNALELLNDMLQAVNPGDRMAVKDELIIDLVDSCRANQKKLMQLITTTSDENLLSQGLEMNDSLQTVLAKHDLIASGAPLPDHERQIGTQQHESVDLSTKPSEAGDNLPTANGKSPVSLSPAVKEQVEKDEEDDEFALIARRHSKTQSGPSQSGTSGVVLDGASSSGSNNALALIDSSPPSTTTNVSKDQNLIDLLSLALTTTSPSETPAAPVSDPVQSTSEAPFNNYVAPWAQPQPQSQSQPQPQPQPQYQYQPVQPQTQQGYYQYASNYPPPPWEITPDYNNQNLTSNPYAYPNYQSNMSNGLSQNVPFQYPQYNNVASYSNTQTSANYTPTQSNPSFQQSFQNPPPPSVNGNSSSIPMQGALSVQQTNALPPKASNPPALNGTVYTSTASPSGQKSFVPSYRLFEDLNVLGSTEAQLKSGPYPSASRDPGRR
ncbi:hypothetical protein KSS87_008789 [Heliosperma pusillum]|nr:hypothetical protein KSS87_008789 [Heliosperma pusillum]